MSKKIVLITGASNGIGYSMAKLFAKNGYSVVINYNKSKQNAEKLEQELVSLGLSAISIKADVSNLNECNQMIEKAVKTFGHIDVLINNAGICSNNILLDETEKNITSVISTNLIGTINCSKAVIPYMINKNNGKIINLSSIWGVCGASGETVYSASKGGIISFTKALAKELAYNNITVNAIAPGVVNTNMMGKYTLEELDSIKSEIPLGRFANSEEIAELALFLASDKANYITGQTIQIDGGFNN